MLIKTDNQETPMVQQNLEKVKYTSRKKCPKCKESEVINKRFSLDIAYSEVKLLIVFQLRSRVFFLFYS